MKLQRLYLRFFRIKNNLLFLLPCRDHLILPNGLQLPRQKKNCSINKCERSILLTRIQDHRSTKALLELEISKIEDSLKAPNKATIIRCIRETYEKEFVTVKAGQQKKLSALINPTVAQRKPSSTQSVWLLIWMKALSN